MATTRSRSLRSNTLLAASSQPPQAVLKLGLRSSLTGHWTLIDPISHRPKYHINRDGQIHRGTSDGPLVATISRDSSSLYRLSFDDGTASIDIKPPRKLSLRGRHRFAIDGRQMYWKRDIVCREASNRRVYAEADCDIITIYEVGEPMIDIIIATFVAVKLKRQTAHSPC